MTNQLSSIDLASLSSVTGGVNFGTGDGRQGYTFNSQDFKMGNGTAPVDYLRCTPAAPTGDGGAPKLDCVDKNGMGWSMPASAGTPTGE